MSEKMVVKTAKSLNRERYIIDRLDAQILSLKEKEDLLRKELVESNQIVETCKLKEQDIKEINMKVKKLAEEEIMKNKKDHNELLLLKDLKKNLDKDLSRAVQDNLNSKYSLEALKESKNALENSLSTLNAIYSELEKEKDQLNIELLNYKKEYEELYQLYELKKTEDIQLKNLYKNYFK